MRVLIAAAVVLLATGYRAHAQEAPQTSQHILTVPTASGHIWNPGIYTSAARCEKARVAFLASARSARLRTAACVEILSP